MYHYETLHKFNLMYDLFYRVDSGNGIAIDVIVVLTSNLLLQMFNGKHQKEILWNHKKLKHIQSLIHMGHLILCWVYHSVIPSRLVEVYDMSYKKGNNWKAEKSVAIFICRMILGIERNGERHVSNLKQ